MSTRRPISVVEWLQTIDLDQFRNEFLFNGYTELHHLCRLTEDDLNCIGITQRGYQKRILSHLPTEAEATLSEFGGGISSSGSVKPKVPPRRLIRNSDKENRENGHSTRQQIPSPEGHTVTTKPSFDDESYLQVSPAEIKACLSDLPREQTAPFSSGSTRSRTLVPEVPQRPSPQVPPRHSENDGASQSGQKPKPPPRKGERRSPPPPLPQRNEKLDVPIPKPVPKQRAAHTQSIPPNFEKSGKPVFPDFDSEELVPKRTNSTNPFRPFSDEQEDYDEPLMLINSEPPTTTSYNPFNPFNTVEPLFPESSLDPDLPKRLQDRPVPQPPQTTSPERTVTTPEDQLPLVTPADLLRRPVPQPPSMRSESVSPPPPPVSQAQAQIRSLPDGSPATSPNISPQDSMEFEYPPPPPPPRPTESLSNRSPPPPPPPSFLSDVPPPVEDLDELPVHSPPPAPLSVPPPLELFDPITTKLLSEREPPPPPPSQQDAEASLMQRLHSRPVPLPPTIPPRGPPPPTPPARSNPTQSHSELRTQPERRESDLIDMRTPNPQIESEPPFRFDSQNSSKEDSMEELSAKFKLNQSFDDNQSLRSKDSPDSGLGFLHDNQSDHSHQSDHSSHHSDHSLAKQDSVESIPPQLPPKSSLSSHSLGSHSSHSFSSHGSQTTSMSTPLETKLSLENIMPPPNAAKVQEFYDEPEYDFLSDAESRPISTEADTEAEYLTLAEAETRPISVFGHAPPPPPPLNHNLHREVPPVPKSTDNGRQDSTASYLMLSDATSGEGFYDVPTTIPKSLPPIPTESSDEPPFQSEDPEPIKPARPAPPPPPGRNSDPIPSSLKPPLPPLQPYARVNKGFIEDDTPISPPSPVRLDNEDEYDELRNITGEAPPHHGSFSSFKELAQSEDSESDAEILDDVTDGEERDDVHSLSSVKIPPISPVSKDFRNLLDSQLKRGSSQYPRSSRTNRHSHSRSIDDKTRRRLDDTLNRFQIPIGGKDEVELIEKSGYLWKQGGAQSNRGFRKRWVVLRNNELRYYENEKKMNETKKIIPVGTMRDVQNLCGAANRLTDGRPNRIVLETIGRTFHFAAETCDEGTIWANSLMKAILLYQPPPGGFPVGGDMSCPEKAGYLKMEGCSQKRYIAIKGEMMCYYNSKADFESAIPVGDIPMKLASVKDLGRNKIQLFTPSKTFVLTADSQQEIKEWLAVMLEAIAEGLSDHTVIARISENPDNKFCAECGMPDPDWASINFGVVVCKQCSGFHRELGVHMSKVRSLKMDVKVWTEELIQLMLVLGNKRANEFWEATLDMEEKPVPDADRDTRQLFLQKKYKAQLYADRYKYDQATLDVKLLLAASADDLEECMRLIYSGANLSHTGEDGKNAYGIAKSHGYSVLAEFLQQNSGYTKVGKMAEGGSNSPITAQRKMDGHGKSFVRTTRDSKQEGIRKSGYLFKTGSNRREFGPSSLIPRDFLRRYCVLEHGILTYYVDEKTTQQQNYIEGIEMVLVAVSEPKAGHKYCFEIVTTYGRAFLFAAETEIERKEWMMALAKIHSIDSMWQSLQKFEFAGFLHKKDGAATTNWQRLWFILKGKSLMYYSVASDCIDEIDLRKVVTLSTELPFMGNLAAMFEVSAENRRISRQEGSERNSSAEFNQYISVVLPGKIVYLRAETKQASDAWFGALQKATAHKGKALDEQQLTGDNVPIIVSECIKFVATHDGFNTEGIYRLSGTNSIISKIVSMFADDPRSVRLNPDEFTLHDVTGALKKYFRDLPDPLMTQKLYKEWIDKAECQDHDTKLQWYHYLLREMPSINYDTLKVLIGHLSSVQAYATENKMYTKNLAAVFGPTLMASSDQSFTNTDKEIKVIADLITYYTWLFGVSDEEITREKIIDEKYRDGLAKLKEAQQQVARRSDMDMDLLVEMYIGNKVSGQSINIKLNKSQSADEILNQVVAQQQLPGDNWSLIEVISNGELERLFHGYEKVLLDIMAWNPQIAAGNYICIKENPLQPHISLYIKSMHAWNGLLKYSEGKKKWNRYHFDLSNNVLNYYRDNRSGSVPIGGWKVADLKIYMGVEKKKAPPTEWGISFTVGNEHTIRAICFEKQDDLYMWLGGLLKSKTEVGSQAAESSNIVDPSMLSYSPANLPPTPSRQNSNIRKSRIPKIPFNWRRSRMPSIDDG